MGCESTVVSRNIVLKLADYAKAKAARARWADEEKRLKEEILADMAYPVDEPVNDLDVRNGDGDPVALVKVGTYRGMDFNHLRDTYPNIYAECETSKATVSIKLP